MRSLPNEYFSVKFRDLYDMIIETGKLFVREEEPGVQYRDKIIKQSTTTMYNVLLIDAQIITDEGTDEVRGVVHCIAMTEGESKLYHLFFTSDNDPTIKDNEFILNAVYVHLAPITHLPDMSIKKDTFNKTYTKMIWEVPSSMCV